MTKSEAGFAAAKEEQLRLEMKGEPKEAKTRLALSLLSSSSSRYLHHESLNWMIEKEGEGALPFSAVISTLQNGSLARKMIMQQRQIGLKMKTFFGEVSTLSSQIRL